MKAEKIASPVSVVRLKEGEPAAAERAARNRRRQRLKLARKGVLLLLALGLVAALVVAMRPKPVPVDVARAVRGALAVEVHATGETRVRDRYVVSAPTAGNLLRLSLEPNDAVAEGASLAQLLPTLSPLLDPRARAEAEARLSVALSAAKQAEAQLALARTADELARTELARDLALGKAGSLSERALEQARFVARMRENEVASAVFASKVSAEQVRLARASLSTRDTVPRTIEVQSPVSGNVLRVMQKSAGVVAPGTPLLELGDLSGLEIVADLLTTDAVLVQPGMPVVIEGWGGEHSLAGRVRKVELAAFTRPSALGVDEQRTNVLIVFNEPRERWAMLGDGYRVEVRLLVWQADQVTKLPLGAVFRRGDGWSVFGIDAAGMAHLMNVQLGHRSETEVEVTSGLAPGAAVIVDPGDRVEDGTRVQPR
ncbi:MAG TPA: HlyD family efflux transporter periplasmic adaptor subunit [Polyangiales bacterium]|jgi:HlyD family secretion protein|nr:HlyD family efflux transporter periplasmic adaptor subunit [Polyangiales bacterium]